MTNAPGTKKKTAAMTQRLMEDVPLWPAAAIQRGPSTVAMLNNKTSQKPIAFRSCDLGSFGDATATEVVTASHPAPERVGPGEGNHAQACPSIVRTPPKSNRPGLYLPAEKRVYQQGA